MSILDGILNIPAEDQPYVQSEIMKEIYRSSLALTAQHLLGYKALTPYTHRDVIQTLQSNTKRKLIVMPRGTFKSSLASVSYPIWLLLKDPNLRILLDSEIYSNSKNFLREIKGHLIAEEICSLFGRFENPTCWNESEIIINQRSKVLKEASITASGIGAEKTGQHYDVIICDDLNSPNNSATPEGIDKVIQHYRYNTSILEPTGTMIVIGTRFHERDLPGFILHSVINQEEGWE